MFIGSKYAGVEAICSTLCIYVIFYKENLDAVHISSDFLYEFLPLRILHVELRPNIPNLQIGTLCV